MSKINKEISHKDLIIDDESALVYKPKMLPFEQTSFSYSHIKVQKHSIDPETAKFNSVMNKKSKNILQKEV